MLTVHNLSIGFGGTYLFESITFQVKPGNRIGLIGKNGAGKSTLLKVLNREILPDEGTLSTDKEIKIGFLKQDIDFVQGRTVLEEAYTAFDEIIAIEKKVAEINEKLATRTDYESTEYMELIEELSNLNHSYEIHGGYKYQGETEKILLGLGFKTSDLNKPTDTFSGGWRMRIELAKLLLQSNDLLLLDEPTNHLDIESIIWFENFLKSFPGAVVLVSHDKMFLDQVTNRTIEIAGGRIYDFEKPYSKYLEIRAELREQQLAAQKNQQKKIEQTEKLIEKFRYKASKASMAQSLIKKIDKIERIEVEDDAPPAMNIQFPVCQTPGKVVLTIQKVSKSFGNHRVLTDISMEIERGDKVAFVGQNGQGKSTLIKAIMQEFDYEGTIELGHQVKLAYFAQNQAEYLDGEQRILDIVTDAADDTNRAQVRDLLGAFLFRGDDVEKKVKVLSGGERNRLALCMMLLKKSNVLLLDEPTNHLDIASKNVLKEAIMAYEGTMIIVSHDRDFLKGLTNKTIEFKDQHTKVFLGDIDYFLEQKRIDTIRDLEEDYIVKQSEKQTNNSKGNLSYEEQKKQKTLKNKISKLEKNIETLESKIQAYELELAENYEQLMQDEKWFGVYEKTKKELEDTMQSWEEALMELEE